VRDLFDDEGLANISIDEVGNVYGRLRGKDENAKALIVSAHLDTVFPASTKLELRREPDQIYGPGIGDNSLGVASLFGIIWSLHEQSIQLKHDIWFVANVGEEGLGDLKGMRAVVDRFGGNIICYLVLEGLALGHIYHRAIGVKRYRITARTKGGHSWSDYGQPSAVHELASLVTQLTSIRLQQKPRTTMNVGTIHGGTGINVLAAEAKCDLDLRSEDPVALEKLIQKVEAILADASREGVAIEAEIIGERPAGEISREHEMVQLALACSKEAGASATLTSGSTDANIPLSRGFPSIVMGISMGGDAHTTNEFVTVSPIKMGMESIVRFVELVR